MSLKKNSRIIIISTPLLIEDDAVGNDAIQEYLALKETEEQVFFFAEESDERFKKQILSLNIFKERIKDPNNIWIYHHSVYWENGEKYLEMAKCKKIIRYHNVTPSFFFEKYSAGFVVATRYGREQTQRLIKADYFDYAISASHYSAEELEEDGFDRARSLVIAPFNRIHDFDSVNDVEFVKEILDNGKINVLFVGRISPNKGHRYLIRTIYEYTRLFDRNIKLNIIGKVHPELVAYYEEIRNLAKRLGVDDVVELHTQVDFKALKTFFKHSDVFLIMSEHEGFGVPILEAQYNKLPIVALDRCAIKETLGEEQLFFSQMDFSMFAGAIYVIANNPDYQEYLVQKGFENFLKYEKKILKDKLIKAVKTYF